MSLAESQRAIQFGRTDIVFSVVRRDRRTAEISVHPDLSVVVVAPHAQSASAVDRLVRQRASWILKQQLRYGDYHPLPSAKRYVSGETHRYMGRQYRLRVTCGALDHVAIRRPFLVVETGDRDPARVQSLVQLWYRERAAAVLARYFRKATDHHPSLRTPNTSLRIAAMARRWGSCSSGGVITLHPQLVEAAPACIEYVVVHELCHRREMNHGRRFLELLTSLMPDWRERRERLNRCT